uniref:ATP-dependent RNA helicase dbp7 n=1 Tax=Lygus hesperus TaxID=30085 RepID=A0A146LIA2_LYGHE
MHRGTQSSNRTDSRTDEDLSRLALFAYQSYLRAYAGIHRTLKQRYFRSSELHLGHVAQSFGIDKGPGEIQRELRSHIRADRSLGRSSQALKIQNNKKNVTTKKVIGGAGNNDNSMENVGE